DPNVDPLELRRQVALSQLVAPTLVPGRSIPVSGAIAPQAGLSTPALDAGTAAPAAPAPSAGPARPGLRAATLDLPDRNDPKYQALQPHGLKRFALTLGAALGGPFAPLAGRALFAPDVAYQRDLSAAKDRLAMEDTESQIEERRAQAAKGEA